MSSSEHVKECVGPLNATSWKRTRRCRISDDRRACSCREGRFRPGARLPSWALIGRGSAAGVPLGLEASDHGDEPRRRRQRYGRDMRPGFEALVQLGPLPADDALDEGTARQYVQAIDAILEMVPTTEEALALVGILPPDDSDALELAWPLLHAIEASPGWPVWSVLDDRNWWVTYLRQRCERAGLSRPMRPPPSSHDHG
jgi:hypothetical protein